MSKSWIGNIPNTHLRDYQRGKVYEAEAACSFWESPKTTEIVIPYPNTKNRPTVCHEMAHVINYNTLNADHHGKYFCGTYLLVVKNFISAHAHLELVKAFEKYKVDYLTSNSINDILVVSNKIID